MKCILFAVLPVVAVVVGVTLVYATSGSGAKEIVVGTEAPKLKVTVDSGEELDLAEVYAKGPVVVFFYPKAMTGGCTAQACSLRDIFGELTKEGVQVLGVSRDSVELQHRFREAHELPYPLVSDHDGAVMKGFGVRQALPGVSAREAFIVVGGKIAWLDRRASTRRQGADVKEALENLRTTGVLPPREEG